VLDGDRIIEKFGKKVGWAWRASTQEENLGGAGRGYSWVASKVGGRRPETKGKLSITDRRQVEKGGGGSLQAIVELAKKQC